MRRIIGLPAIALVIGMAAVVGCSSGVSQDDYDKIENDLRQARAQLTSANAELSTTQAQLQSTQTDLENMEEQLESTQDKLLTAQEQYKLAQAKLSTAQAQLESAQADLAQAQGSILPGDFQTVAELEDWAEAHLEEGTEFAESTFRNAVRVQQAGLADGYLISIDLDYISEDETWLIWCNAFAGNQYYEWYPENDYYDGIEETGFEK